MAKHNKEKWELRKHNETNLFGAKSPDSDWFIFENSLEKNATRILQCVNALAGIEDVEAFVKEAKLLMEAAK